MRALEHHKKVKATVEVEFTDEAGNTDTEKQVVRLR